MTGRVGALYQFVDDGAQVAKFDRLRGRGERGGVRRGSLKEMSSEGKQDFKEEEQEDSRQARYGGDDEGHEGVGQAVGLRAEGVQAQVQSRRGEDR
uniref:Uncharacterized protein n=1 Tax=Globodera pallida TaxID=36090 RepID=A0A183BP04_GLOPA